VNIIENVNSLWCDDGKMIINSILFVAFKIPQSTLDGPYIISLYPLSIPDFSLIVIIIVVLLSCFFFRNHAKHYSRDTC
jgi:hypothetical protein